jgi:hypothetical protein
VKRSCRVSPAPDDLSVAFAGGSDASLDARARHVSARKMQQSTQIVTFRVSSLEERRCLWCEAVLPGSTRRDAKFCSKRCRQSSWRFRVCRADIETTDRPMIFAYADPPYPGKALIYPERSEVDHASLLQLLTENYPDGWALSTSSEALRDVLPLCPKGVRICAWFKGPRCTKSRRALVSWEPVIVAGGRPLQINVVQDLSERIDLSRPLSSIPRCDGGDEASRFR